MEARVHSLVVPPDDILALAALDTSQDHGAVGSDAPLNIEALGPARHRPAAINVAGTIFGVEEGACVGRAGAVFELGEPGFHAGARPVIQFGQAGLDFRPFGLS